MDPVVSHGSNYATFIESFSEPTTPLLNGYVIHFLQVTPRTSLNAVCRQLAVAENLVNINDALYFKRFVTTVSKLQKNLQCLRRKQQFNWHKIIELLKQPFVYQTNGISGCIP